MSKYDLFFLLFLVIILLPNLSSRFSFGVSPSFGHQEVRDPFRDLIDMKCSKAVPKDVDMIKCAHAHRGNQSTDILAVDFFSNGRFLNATIWLVSPIEENKAVNDTEETNYGMFIDADSNQKTGWQGIDYQVENHHKNGKWNKTLYEFSSIGKQRILNETNNYTTSFYQKNNNYVTLYADLNAIGSPDKYKVMFYAEELKGTVNAPILWIDDFTSWIDIPRPQFTLLTTPSNIVLRPGQEDSYGIQLLSNTTFIPKVSDFKADENTSNVNLRFITPKINSSASTNEPESLDIKIPEAAQIGIYNVPIIANVTQTSTIPNIFGFNNMPLNIAYEFDKLNIPVTVIKKMSIEEQLADFNKTWIAPLSGIYTFLGGLLTGGAAQSLYKRLKKKQNENEEPI